MLAKIDDRMLVFMRLHCIYLLYSIYTT